MYEFLLSLTETSITMSVIAMIYIAITPLISKKYAAKSRYYTWLIIILGLIIPFRFQIPTPIIQVETPIINTVPLIVKKFTYGISINQTVPNQVTSPGISPFTIIFVIWLIGVIVFLAYHLNRHRKFLKSVRRLSTDISDKKTVDIFKNVKLEMRLAKHLNLQICTGITSPMLIGFLHPTILLGSENIPESELALIFKHELVHFRRKDLWYKVLVVLAGALHWFNPIVHIMAREISNQCEISCDAEVTKNTDILVRQKYVESIIGIIRQQTRVQTAFSTNLYSGKQDIKKRVFSIMDIKKKKISFLIPVIIILFSLSTGTVFVFSIPKTDLVTPTALQAVIDKPKAEHSSELPAQQIPKAVPVITNVNVNKDGIVSAHSIPMDSTYTYSNVDNTPWMLYKDQEVIITLELSDTSPIQQTTVGYILNDKMVELYSDKINSKSEIKFTVPQNGDYRFYITASSDSNLTIKHLSVLSYLLLQIGECV